MSGKLDICPSFEDFHSKNPSSVKYGAKPVCCHTTNLVGQAEKLQPNKMPGLLRLDSVGEDSSVRISADSQFSSRSGAKKSLHPSYSFDTSLLSRGNFFTNSNMLSLKSLMSNPIINNSNGFHTQASSFVQVPTCVQSSPPQSQLQLQNHSGIRLKSAFVSYQQSPILNKISSSAFMLSPQITDFNNTLSVADIKKQLSNEFWWKLFDAHSSTSAEECQQQESKPACSPSLESMESIKTESVPSSSSSLDPLSLSSSPDKSAAVEIKTTLKSLNKEEKYETEEVTENVVLPSDLIEETCFETTLGNKHIEQRSATHFDLESLSQVGSNYENDLNKCKNRKSISKDTFQECIEVAADIPSVLSAPRKTCKKGRPSSKKQRKRRREKQKHETLPLLKGETNPAKNFDSTCPVEIKTASCQVSNCINILVNKSKEFIGQFKKVNSQADHCPVTAFFYRARSDSETTDYEDAEWGAEEDENTMGVVMPAFNTALDLDTIFKRNTIPSLHSVLGADESESDSEINSPRQSSVCRKFDVSSLGDGCPGIQAERGITQSKITPCDLFAELITSTHSDLHPTTKVPITEFDNVDGPSDDDHYCFSVSEDTCAIDQINVRWDECYPTAGFRSCTNSGEIVDSRIKVHFAEETELLTVHLVGTEDRAGTWHHFALDHERFQRRILDVGLIIAPVLEAGHRARMWNRICVDSSLAGLELKRGEATCSGNPVA